MSAHLSNELINICNTFRSISKSNDCVLRTSARHSGDVFSIHNGDNCSRLKNCWWYWIPVLFENLCTHETKEKRIIGGPTDRVFFSCVFQKSNCNLRCSFIVILRLIFHESIRYANFLSNIYFWINQSRTTLFRLCSSINYSHCICIAMQSKCSASVAVVFIAFNPKLIDPISYLNRIKMSFVSLLEYYGMRNNGACANVFVSLRDYFIFRPGILFCAFCLRVANRKCIHHWLTATVASNKLLA